LKISIMPGRLEGAVTPPPSKSISHRAIIAAALCPGRSRINNLALSQDIKATLLGVRAMGASIMYDKEAKGVSIYGIRNKAQSPKINCGESGSTIRFLIPIVLALYGRGDFCGRGRLLSRPLDEYLRIFTEKGISWSFLQEKMSLKGELPAGEYRLRGDVSSQFISGLLFALPLLAGDSKIILTTPLEGIGYIEMTLDILNKAGIEVSNGYYAYFTIKGGQSYSKLNLDIEADYSQAAFYFAANAIGNNVDIRGLAPVSSQGDRHMVLVCRQLAEEGEKEIDVCHIPDLLPAIAVIAALRNGYTTKLTNASRLRLKESDRLTAVASELNKLGASIKEEPDALIIRGVKGFRGGVTESHNDHRIAMALAIAATRAKGEVIIEGAESVKKSYPNFWEHYKSLGGVLHEI